MNVTALEAGFANPPRENRPQVWWWFDNEAPRESIVRDLRAMRRAGLGGFHFRKFVEDPSVFKFAVREAMELGLEVVSMVGAGGCGHPGVPPALSQKELVFTAADVTGGGTIRRKLARTGVRIKTWNERNFDLRHFTDLRTYAVPKSGGPAEPVVMEELKDWTSFDDPGIRYYSGTAVYRAAFGPLPFAERCWLELERLGPGNVAEVFDDGKSLGVLWTPPYRVEITGAKDLSIHVTNQWPNRLIYDASLPEEKRLTRTNINPYQPTAAPMPSGLLGSVRIRGELSILDL